MRRRGTSRTRKRVVPDRVTSGPAGVSPASYATASRCIYRAFPCVARPARRPTVKCSLAPRESLRHSPNGRLRAVARRRGPAQVCTQIVGHTRRRACDPPGGSDPYMIANWGNGPLEPTLRYTRCLSLSLQLQPHCAISHDRSFLMNSSNLWRGAVDNPRDDTTRRHDAMTRWRHAERFLRISRSTAGGARRRWYNQRRAGAAGAADMEREANGGAERSGSGRHA